MPQVDIDLINAHQQIANFSCIPSAVEMVLKAEGKVAHDYYELQQEWQNRADGSFAQFVDKELFGLRFKPQFCLARDEHFPLKELFGAIDAELAANRYVIISLASPGGWHMAVIYDRDGDDYKALTKISYDGAQKTIRLQGIKDVVVAMRGTDILTYTRNEA